jgi:hypothetical protein
MRVAAENEPVRVMENPAGRSSAEATLVIVAEETEGDLWTPTPE